MIRISKSGAPESFHFDAADVDWKPFVTEGCFYRILHVNVPERSAEMIVKFTPGGRCAWHRHAARVKTMVLQGDLQLYEPTPDGEKHSVKPAGSFSVSPGGEVHIEGSDEGDVIVYFSMQAETDVIYEILHEDLSLRRAVTVQDFHDDWKSWEAR
ncbi:MAG: cupin domain-containing protein [Candidatus Binatia bacterium]